MSKPVQAGKWPTGLCGCFSDCGTCCYGFWCNPCLYGSNAAQHGGNCFANCCLYYVFGLLLPFACCFTGNREKLRANHGLAPEPCSDCCTMCWCAPCAVCQEARVIKTHGAAPQFYAQPQYYAQPPPQQQMY